MPSDKTAIAFPGQGAHNAQMLDKYASMPEFRAHYNVVADALGFSPIETFKSEPTVVNRNGVSSLLTVLASKLAYLRYLESGAAPGDFFTGYSVGQYTALHIAGCFDFEHLVQIVSKRSHLMDRCFEQKQGSMLAIAGVPQVKIDELLTAMAVEGFEIWISNYNCFGQYSLAGTKAAIAETLKRAVALEPKRLVELPVGGAWHCPLLNDSMNDFDSFLQPLQWDLPKSPVINNVTGEFMPDSIEPMKKELVKHLSHPVRWEGGIKTLIAAGCTTFTEVGYGNVLTKFGFFIDRSLDFTSFSGEAQAVCAE